VTVTEPTSPKKQSLMPASRLRKALRAAGHHLSPVVQIGKEGATPAVAQALDAQLLAHELVKVKVGSESPEGRFEVAAWLAGLPGAQVAQVLGRTVLLYRKHPQKPRFEPGTLPPAAPSPSTSPLRGYAQGRRSRGGRQVSRPAPRRPARRPAPRRGPTRSG
jgi:RNA-binding protein